MMTTAEPEGQFSADLPEEIRKRIAAAGDLQRVLDSLGTRGKDLLPKTNPKLTYAEPQNCALHFLSPSHDVIPSFTTVAGLSLCPECALQAGNGIVQQRLSAAEMIDLAVIGQWLIDGLDTESRAA